MPLPALTPARAGSRGIPEGVGGGGRAGLLGKWWEYQGPSLYLSQLNLTKWTF